MTKLLVKLLYIDNVCYRCKNSCEIRKPFFFSSVNEILMKVEFLLTHKSSAQVGQRKDCIFKLNDKSADMITLHHHHNQFPEVC